MEVKYIIWLINDWKSEMNLGLFDSCTDLLYQISWPFCVDSFYSCNSSEK